MSDRRRYEIVSMPKLNFEPARIQDEVNRLADLGYKIVAVTDTLIVMVRSADARVEKQY